MLRESAARTYAAWSEQREPYLRRARDASRLTIPSLVPDKSTNPHGDLPTPFQGLGAQGVNNLASKLLLSLFPPTQPFFRLLPTDPEALRQSGPKVQTEVEEGLSRMERVILGEFEVQGYRTKLFEALKHLIVSGNVCAQLTEEGPARVFSLEQYVARRDPLGRLECLILREELDRDYLPPELEALVPQAGQAGSPFPGPAMDVPSRKTRPGQGVAYLFTCVQWDPDKGMYLVHQELDGVRVPDSRGSYKPEMLPWMVERYVGIDGEDYGRGMVEEVIGDLVSLEGLMQAIVEAAAIVSRCVGLVDPAGAATADDLNRARNGDYVVGRATDVSYPPVNKNGDLQFALVTVQQLTDRLKQAFLLNTAVQRQAERVTAEEVRFVAQELEQALGGVFSVLSQELQLPIVRILMARLQRQKRIAKLPARSVRPAVVTGVEALGRGQDLSRLQIATQIAQQVVGPDQAATYQNVRVLLGMIYAAAGLDTSEVLRTEEEVAAQRQQQLMIDMAGKLGPSVIDQAGPGIVERMGLAPGGGAPAKPPPATPAS